MNDPLVYVVIVNWNRWEITARSVASVMDMHYTNLQVVVVDNHSESGGEDAFRQQWPEVTIIHNSRNAGFATAANLGIRQALTQGAAFIFMLNNDAIVANNCLAELMAALHKYPDAGIVGPKIYYMASPSRIWFAGANRHPWLLSLLDFGRGQMDSPRFSRPRAVNYLCAGAMLVRRELWASVGLFDPGYFMYYEDCDFCMRVCEQGYCLYYVPTAWVWHEVAASSGGEGTPLEVYYRTRSVFRFLWQHSHGLHKVFLLGLRLVYVIGLMIWHWLRGQTALAHALSHGLQDGLRYMTVPPKDRSL